MQENRLVGVARKQARAWPSALLATGVLLVVGDHATAQPTQVRVRGVVERAAPDVLEVKSRDGEPLRLRLSPKVPVTAVKAFRLGDIKAGDYVGTTVVMDPDGNPRALEVHVFPEALRGAGEGSQASDLAQGSSMINATIGEAAAAPQGRVLTLRFKGQAVQVKVPAETPVVTYAPGQIAMLTPGKAVFISASRAADGTLEAQRITVESDGVKPAM